MRGQIMMKRTVPLALIAAVLLFAMCSTEVRADPGYEKFMSIKPGETYIFTYTVIPKDPQAHQSQMSTDITFVINTIVDIAINYSCNLTYTASFKMLVNGIATDHVERITRFITNSTNSTEYVYNATNPLELFFMNNNKTISKRTVIVPENASLDIGYGSITWDAKGVLNAADFHTQIDGIGNCLIQIRQKAAGAPPVSGYSMVLILVIAAIPTALLVNKFTKKVRRENIE
ncbi:MAG: hypothetical protein Q6373_018405 [Candidatus Sigynarchaeota archaeon]